MNWALFLGLVPFLHSCFAAQAPPRVLPALALASPSWPSWLTFSLCLLGNCCLCGLLPLERLGGATATQLGSQLFVLQQILLCLKRARTSSSPPRLPKFPLEQSFPFARHASLSSECISSTRTAYCCLALLTRAPLLGSPAPLPLRISSCAVDDTSSCGSAECVRVDLGVSNQVSMQVFVNYQAEINASAWILEPTRMRCQVNTRLTKQGLKTMCMSRQEYSLCKVRNTNKKKKLQCMMPSCRLASGPHRIKVRTRGRCTRAHEFPSAPDHSTHCWAYTQCNLPCTAPLCGTRQKNVSDNITNLSECSSFEICRCL